MADVMDQRQRFGEVTVEFENRRDGAGDLRDFNRVGQTVPEMIGKTGREDLGLVLSRRKAREWMMRSRSRWKSPR